MPRQTSDLLCAHLGSALRVPAPALLPLHTFPSRPSTRSSYAIFLSGLVRMSYYERNKEKCKESSRRWAAANPDYVKAYRQKYFQEVTKLKRQINGRAAQVWKPKPKPPPRYVTTITYKAPPTHEIPVPVVMPSPPPQPLVERSGFLVWD